MENQSIEGTAQEKKLYDLIWKRTIASQMADAELEKTTVTISISSSSEVFTAIGEVIKFDGFCVYTVNLMTMKMNKRMKVICCLL